MKLRNERVQADFAGAEQMPNSSIPDVPPHLVCSLGVAVWALAHVLPREERGAVFFMFKMSNSYQLNRALRNSRHFIKFDFETGAEWAGKTYGQLDSPKSDPSAVHRNTILFLRCHGEGFRGSRGFSGWSGPVLPENFFLQKFSYRSVLLASVGKGGFVRCVETRTSEPGLQAWALKPLRGALPRARGLLRRGGRSGLHGPVPPLGRAR